MRSIKAQKNQSTEVELIKLFRLESMKGWRRKYPLFGRPDFVFLKSKLAIFVDGCFWHGHNCRNVKPKQNHTYWDAKIKRNKKRDRLVKQKIETRGWRVMRIWECKLKKEEDKILKKITEVLTE